MTALRRTLNLARPDDVYNAIVDAHKGLNDQQCRDFDARLILKNSRLSGLKAGPRRAPA